MKNNFFVQDSNWYFINFTNSVCRKMPEFRFVNHHIRNFYNYGRRFFLLSSHHLFFFFIIIIIVSLTNGLTYNLNFNLFPVFVQDFNKVYNNLHELIHLLII